jgi:hypothetical protein
LEGGAETLCRNVLVWTTVRGEEGKAKHGQTDLVGAETGELLEMLFPDSRDGDFVHGILNRPQKRGDAIGITQDLRDILSVHLQLGLDDIV